MSKKKDNDAWFILLVIAVVVAIVALPFAYEMWTHRARHPSALAELEPRDESMRIEHKNMVGTFRQFDVVANAKFATDLAQAWSKDAQLEAIEVERGALDVRGNVDVSGNGRSKPSVIYELVAQSSGAAHSSNPRTPQLRLKFSDGEIHATVTSAAPFAAPAPTLMCSLSTVAAAVNSKGIRKYSLNLRWNDGTSRWTWYASGSDGYTDVCEASCTLIGTAGCHD